jgi:PmbA protein
VDSIQIEPIFEKIERSAKADGCEVELLLEAGERFSVSFESGKLEKYDTSSSRCAGFRVIDHGYEGYSYSEDLSEAALMLAYRKALENAKFTAKAADPSRQVRLFRGGGDVAEMPELFNTSGSEMQVSEKIESARKLEAAAKEYDARIASVPYNAYVESEGEIQILTSAGIRRRQRYSGVHAYAYCIARQNEESRMSGESFFTRQARELKTEEVARVAAQRALEKLGATPPLTGNYPVVIDCEVASEIFGLISDYFSAKAVKERNSLFSDELGNAIASSKLTVVDDPFLKDGLGTRAFDSEGAASCKTTLIENGKLTGFLTNSVYAERMKLPHTASGSRGARGELDISISNMVVQKGQASLEDLLKRHPKLIFVTEFTGYHSGFTAGSGDFSLQAEGELWENGKRVRPLSNFVVSGNIRQLLLSIEDLSSRVRRPVSAVIAPDLLIRELSIAGE